MEQTDIPVRRCWHPIAGVRQLAMAWKDDLIQHLPTWLHWPSRTAARHILIGILLGFSLSATTTSVAAYLEQRKKERQIAHFAPRPIELRSDEIVKGVVGLIGTPIDTQKTRFTYCFGRKYTFGQN